MCKHGLLLILSNVCILKVKHSPFSGCVFTICFTKDKEETFELQWKCFKKLMFNHFCVQVSVVVYVCACCIQVRVVVYVCACCVQVHVVVCVCMLSP